MMIHLSERVWNVVKDNPEVQKYSKEISSVWTGLYDSDFIFNKLNQIGFKYMLSVYRAVKHHENELCQFYIGLHDFQANELMVFYENVDAENKLDILYRLMDMGYSREWCKDTFIELFESLSKDEMSKLSASIVKLYYIIKISRIHEQKTEEVFTKAMNIYHQLLGIFGDDVRLIKMLNVGLMDQMIIRLRDDLQCKPLTACTAMMNKLFDIVTGNLHKIDAMYLIYNTRFLHYFLEELMTEFNSGKDYSSKLQFLRTYLFECLEHREMTHRSLITDNEFMYPQFIVLVNAIYMILDVEDQVKLRRLLHQNEYQFIIPLSENHKLSNYVFKHVQKVANGDMGVASMKYYEVQVYHMIENLLIHMNRIK